jgi:hypothetical protein
MRYVQRDKSGKLVGHFANPNPLATEVLEDDHPEIAEWEEWRFREHRKAKDTRSVDALLKRIEKLEQALALK